MCVVQDRDISVVILAECDLNRNELATALSANRLHDFRYIRPSASRVMLFTSLAEEQIKPVYEDEGGHLSIHRLRVEGTDVLLGTVHLPDKRSFISYGSQASFAQRVADDVRRQERTLGVDRAIIVGDFNMDPYEPGMIGAFGFHALMAKTEAERETRTVLGRAYPTYYNPMWGHFGDRVEGPTGTFYYHSSEPVAYFWHMYDQVIARGPMAKQLLDVTILTGCSGYTFTSRNGRPGGPNGSDHLPLAFSLDL